MHRQFKLHEDVVRLTTERARGPSGGDNSLLAYQVALQILAPKSFDPPLLGE